MERKYVQNSFFNKWVVKWGFPLMLLTLLLFIKQFPAFIEQYYSEGFYTIIALVLRRVTGLFGFSVGDVLYGVLIIYAIIAMVAKVKFILSNKPNATWFKNGFKNAVLFLLWLYIVFLVVWGLNYNRQGLAKQLQLQAKEYTVDELKNFTCKLQEKLSVARQAIGDTNFIFPTDEQQIQLCIAAYDTVKKRYPFLAYPFPSTKKSLLYHLVSSAGYSGYYNPFSGEAQINEDVPAFYKGFVIAHEMGHQIGYASESEASFSSYLACKYSGNTILQYSALYELFASANNELFMYDAAAAYLNLKDLHPSVKYDRRKYRLYLLGKQNTFEPIIKNVYDQYLKANDQHKGVESYNDVVAWVMAYEERRGVR
jgi:hypothetical protein